MQYNTIDYQAKDFILTLTLHRPEQLNAFTVEMAHELVHAFDRASADDAVRAIVVTGAGRAFCADCCSRDCHESCVAEHV